MQSITALLDKLPHWLVLVVTIFVGGSVSYLTSTPTATILGALTTTAGALALLKGGAIAGVVAVVAWLKTPPSGMPAAKTAAKVAAVALALSMLGGSQTACISVSPTVPVTPQNKAEVDSCTSTATEHNGFVLGGLVLGGLGTTAGSVAAALPQSDQSTRVGLAVGAAAAAGLAGIAAGGAGLTAKSFTDARCTDVVTPLPMHPAPAATLLPSFYAMDETTVTMTRVER
jgi:hypothetical protein